jgi:hypothetical protein
MHYADFSSNPRLLSDSAGALARSLLLGEQNSDGLALALLT